jgi:hypothetical protein
VPPPRLPPPRRSASPSSRGCRVHVGLPSAVLAAGLQRLAELSRLPRAERVTPVPSGFQAPGKLVRMVGLEPARRYPLVPETSANLTISVEDCRFTEPKKVSGRCTQRQSRLNSGNRR